MREGVASAMLRFFGARAPQDFARATLDFLAAASGTKTAALFEAQASRPRLVTTTGLSQDSLDRALDSWKRQRTRLERGETVQGEGHSLVPLLRDGAPVGLLYLESTNIDRIALIESQELLAAAVLASRAEPAAPVADFLERTPVAELQREKLMLLLERHDWNISRVAREMGVTRTTIYAKLDLFEIPRRVGQDRRQRSARFARRSPGQ